MVKSKSSYPKIEEQLEQHNIVLFMKGSKSAPQCGFSAKVVAYWRISLIISIQWMSC